MTIPTELPPELADFDFIIAWEEFKAHRAATGYPINNEEEILDWCSSFGPLWATHKIIEILKFEKLVLQTYSERRKSDPSFKPTEAICSNL